MLALLWILPAQADFLTPQDAFQPEVEAVAPDRLLLRWRIAEGYYLYRDKLGGRSLTPGIDLGAPVWPEALTKDDEFFGSVAIYRDRVEIPLALARTPDSGDTLSLEFDYQGCADAGFCYPPERARLEIRLPALAAAAAPVAAPAPSFSQALGLAPAAATSDIPPVEQAFRLSVEVRDAEHLSLHWEIDPTAYLYRDLIELRLTEDTGVTLGEARLPEGILREDGVLPDGHSGPVTIYKDRLSLELPLHRTPTDSGRLVLEVRYQGCAEQGICYPPQNQRLALELPPAPASAKTLDAPASAAPSTSNVTLNEQDRIAATLAGASLWASMVLFFGFGLLLAFTPCVFPMIPILSGIIAGQGQALTTRRAFVLSLIYVLAMSATYTLAGVLAGLFGANLQAAFQSPWILGAFALVFVALAFSMFGFYELQLPSGLQTRLSALSNRQQGGTWIGTAIMGALSALIVSPCVAPPLVGALIYIGQTGDALLGGAALFALSLGMGAPLLLIGASAGQLLPRAGAWMERVKAVFGVAMLGVAILMLERVLPEALSLLLWGMLLIGSAIYMGALDHLAPEASGWQRLWKALGLVLLIQGALVLVGAASGGGSVLQPLRALAASAPSERPALTFRPIKTVADLERELAEAQGRPVLLDFQADWCLSCKEMEHKTFADPAVAAELQRFVRLQADVTANDADDRALMQGRFALPGPPALLFFDGQGEELVARRLVGFTPPRAFLDHLRRIGP
ncbi:MAG: protein-disulfide reductase DsbD [Chromatiaceae bacterium]|nr:protein-disulfide reductase DsbD [Chromatiaceae bacterium]